MAVTRGFIIPRSALIQHRTAGQDKREVNTLLTGLCDSHSNMLAACPGDSNGWGRLVWYFHVFLITNEMWRSCKRRWGFHTQCMMSSDSLRPFTCPPSLSRSTLLKIHRASLIHMLSSQLGGQGMQAASLVFNFKSHILSLRTQRSWPLVPVEFHMQK